MGIQLRPWGHRMWIKGMICGLSVLGLCISFVIRMLLDVSYEYDLYWWPMFIGSIVQIVLLLLYIMMPPRRKVGIFYALAFIVSALLAVGYAFYYAFQKPVWSISGLICLVSVAVLLLIALPCVLVLYFGRLGIKGAVILRVILCVLAVAAALLHLFSIYEPYRSQQFDGYGGIQAFLLCNYGAFLFFLGTIRRECPRCGNILGNQARYCRTCGASLFLFG